MSARDYQHQRFQSRGSDSGGNNYTSAPPPYSESPSLTVDTSVGGSSLLKTPPRAVTPSAPSPAREVHDPTANSGSLTYISPLKPKDPNMRYSLKTGVERQSASTAAVVTPCSDNGDVSEGKSSRSKSSGTNRDLKKKSNRSSGSRLFSSSLRKHDPSSYKIFLLLLQPKLKTFELIQLIYSPNDTTIGNIIEMIPENATEPALGSQVYCGLCRPKTQEEILDMELLASESHQGVVSAKITLGEILVAIPYGYTGPDVAVLAKQILANPKIVKLLKRADPLAPKKSRRSSRRHHRSSRRSRSKEHVEVMEKFNEEDEIKQDQERRMKEAMEHAQQEAAAANAQIPGGGGSKLAGVTRSLSIASLEDSKSVESSLQESLDDSYTSWSKSFDASFASSVCSGVSKRQMRRRERQVRRSRILRRAAVMAFIIMLALYFLDPRGYSRVDQSKTDLITATPMGMTGIFQCLFLLLTLYKIERLIRASNHPDGRSQGKHHCPFLKAANSAAKKFKSRYAKKLKKPVTGHFEEDEQSLSRKLRSFSLKANTIPPHPDDDDELTQ